VYKIIKKAYPLTPILALGMPLLVSAQSLQDIITTFRSAVDVLIPLLMGLCVAVFLWGLVKYMWSAGDSGKQTEAKGYIIYGLIGIFVLVAFWGIVSFIALTFGIGRAQTGNFPIFTI